MDNLDITPAFIDIFQRINKHLDLLPFQKLLNDKNSTLSDHEKIELKTKINESAKKVRQLNLVIDELKDQIVAEIEKIQIDYEEKNRDLDLLEEHLNYVRTNQLTNQQKEINVLRERTKELNNEMNLNNEPFNDENELNLDYDEIDTGNLRKESNKLNQESLRKFNQPKPFKLPSSSNLKPPSSNLKPPSKPFSSNNISKGSSIKKPSDEFYNQQQNSNNKFNNIKNQIQNRNNNDRIYQLHQQQQQSKKEKIKNVDNIYLNYPQINYISLSEFNYIPNYMRGRLSFEKCNSLVDEFNKTIETKYKFMLIPTSKYSSDELIKYTLYKSQEDDETRGLFFVTPKDLHDYSDLKISLNDTKIFIQCVRHCKRIKEIRGTDRLIRYVVLNC